MASPRSGAADCTVGSIVWVRRRNGSWWPGKILGSEELDATHITSPRSGTPVKLLGREDASVDWYNLEKSKRVKAFRCGDFDECIERVESAQGFPIRKREKYARREDAILHALKLEKEMLKREGKLVPERKIRKEPPDAAKERLRDQEIYGSRQEPMRCLRPTHIGGSEDETAPRMRELQDFGLRTASSKQRFQCSNGREACSNSPASSSGDQSMERFNYPLGKEHARSTIQCKSRRYMYEPIESNDALGFHEREIDTHHSLLEDKRSDCSQSDTDSSDTDYDMPMLSGARPRLEGGQNAFSTLMAVEDESVSSEDHEEDSSISGDSSYLSPHDPDFGTESVSKLQHKGRRNLFHLPVRKSPGKIEARYRDPKKRAFSRISIGYGSDYNDEANDPASDDNASRCKNIFGDDMLDWDDDPWELWIGPKIDGKSDRFGLNSGRSRNLRERNRYPLIDVDLEVRGSYEKGHVPIVSLVSKFDGRAIIGHPIEVEVLPNGSSQTYVGKPFKLPHAWKTARRSNSRVPRLNPMKNIDDRGRIRRSPGMKKSSRPGNFRQIPRPQQKKYTKRRALSSFGRDRGVPINPEADHNSSSSSSSMDHRRVLEERPTVTCIPVKLVFSRLLEKINRPPLKPA